MIDDYVVIIHDVILVCVCTRTNTFLLQVLLFVSLTEALVNVIHLVTTTFWGRIVSSPLSACG